MNILDALWEGALISLVAMFLGFMWVIMEIIRRDE